MTTPPVSEYCLLWINWWPLCMSRGDWATWVQALGALLALAVAIGLAYQASRRGARQANAAAMLFAQHTLKVARALAAACSEESMLLLQSSRAVMAEVSVLGRSIDMTQLEAASMDPMLRLRGLAAECAWMADQAARPEPEVAMPWHEWAGRFHLMVDAIRDQVAKL